MMGLFKKKEHEEFDIIKINDNFDNTGKISKASYMKCPDWLMPEYDRNGQYAERPDELFALYDPFLQRRFYREGKIAFGALVQANVLLFKKGDDDCPANFIYSTDKYYWEHQDEMILLADALFSTKGYVGFHPSIQRLADLITDEYSRVFCYKLPRDITEGREVYMTTVMVQRDHLPKKKIIGRKYPMLVLENNEPDAMILPYLYWK